VLCQNFKSSETRFLQKIFNTVHAFDKALTLQESSGLFWEDSIWKTFVVNLVHLISEFGTRNSSNEIFSTLIKIHELI